MKLDLSNISDDTLALNPDLADTLRKKNTKHDRRKLEYRFLEFWNYLGGPELKTEYRFHPSRMWRFDFALPEQMIAIEINGGTWMARSGHNYGQHVTRDYEKYNAAALLGWRLFLFTSDMLSQRHGAQHIEPIIALAKG